MRYVEGKNRSQREALPPSLDERIRGDHPIRVVDAFVEGLDIEGLGFVHAEPAETGRMAYDPRDLLKLYLYGYMNRVRSSRRLMRECGRNIEVMWLLNSLTPDFHTISDFRKDNRKAIKEVFRAFVQILIEMKLLGGEEFSVDGTKVRAWNSIKRSYTPEVVEKKLAYIRDQMERLEAYLADMDSYDTREETLHLDLSKEQMPGKLAELRERVKKYEGYKARFAAGEKQILETDPDSRTLHSKDGLHPAYNVQSAVDTQSHLIADFEVTNANTDQNLLSVMGEKVKESLDVGNVQVIADKGYESREDIERCVMNGIVPDVGFKYDKTERVFTLDHVEAEITEAQRISTKPEDIQACLHAGELPRCYEGTNIRVEVQGLSEVSCFVRHEDGTVTCPMGRTLYKRVEKKLGIQYGSQEACRTCPNRCTDSKGAKTVLIGYNSNCVPVLMYGSSQYALQKPPQDAKISPYNHALDRKSRAKSQVKLTIRRDIAKQQIRKETAEHPFGTLKWYDGYHYFLCKGKENVAAETALSYLSYDLKRAIVLTTSEHSPVPGILMHLRAKNQGKRVG